MTPRLILLNPGPVTLTDRVRRALGRPDQCHREPEFAALTLEIKRRLARVYPDAADEFTALLLTGSGTCAVEAMVSSLLPEDSTTLLITNGVYGERMGAMAEAHGKPVKVLREEWLAPIDLASVERCLLEDPGIRRVVAVHNETTTGRLNDLEALGRLCRRLDRALLLDAVSSFGAEHLDFRSWNLEAVAATANKCLHGAPGVSFVLVKNVALETRRTTARSLYLDLFGYHREQQAGSSPFTQAVHVCYALNEALEELEDEGGPPARRDRYQYVATVIRRALRELGVRPLIPLDAYSSMISSFELPAGLSYAAVHDPLREAGFVIYAGQGTLASSIFRVANMGDIRDDDLERLLDTFKAVFGAKS